MRETFMKMTKNNESPVNQEYLINLAYLDMQEAEKTKLYFKQFDRSSLETSEERIDKMKRICAKYNLPLDMFDKQRDCDPKYNFDHFVKVSEKPYFDYKKNGDIDSTLIQKKYVEHPRLHK